MSSVVSAVMKPVASVVNAVTGGVNKLAANPVSTTAMAASLGAPALAAGPSNPVVSAADQAAQGLAGNVARGTATTLLTGTEGVDPDKLQTSKVLLGQ